MTREEAVDWLQSRKEHWEMDDDGQELAQALQMGIEALENQKTAHWIDDEFGSKCSCCDIHTHLDKFDRPMKFKYCSMCGAKMEGERE